MPANYYFPTVISSTIETELAKDMLVVARKYLDTPELLTNTWGYKNTYSAGSGIGAFNDVQPFVEYINFAAREFLLQAGYDPSGLSFKAQVFVSEMFENDYHAVHCHPNSLLSGILYLDVPEGSSPIVFTDPRPFRNFISLPRIGDAPASWEQVSFTPEPGLFLIWESWLAHEVPKNLSKSGRVTMVFNLVRNECD